MESTHLLGEGKKRVKIHPHSVTAKYATPPAPSHPHGPAHTRFPQPGDDGYDDAPSFEDFPSFLEETSSDKKRLTEGRKWPGRTLFGGGGGGKEKIKDMPLRPTMPSGTEGGATGAMKGGGVGEQLASFGEASVSASRFTWLGLLVAAAAGGTVVSLTRLASSNGLGPLYLLLVRSVLQLLACLAIPLRLGGGRNPFGPRGQRLRLALYGVSYSLSLCCQAASLSFLSPDHASVTWRLATTALSAALAFLLLEERLGLADGGAVLAGVAGLGLALVGGGVAWEERAGFWRMAFGWSLSAMAGLWMALSLVAYRALKERAGLGEALFAISWTGCVLTTASMVLLGEGPVWPPGAPGWGLVLGVAGCGAGAFLGITHGLSRIHPALVSASQGVEVPVAMLLQLATLPSLAPPTAWQVGGAIVVTLSVGCLVAMKLLPSRSTGRRQREEYEEILDSPIK